MSDPARRSRVACWRRPSAVDDVSDELEREVRNAHFWGRQRGGGLLGFVKSQLGSHC